MEDFGRLIYLLSVLPSVSFLINPLQEALLFMTESTTQNRFVPPV